LEMLAAISTTISSSVQNQHVVIQFPLTTNISHSIAKDFKQQLNVHLIFFSFCIFHFTSQFDSLLHGFRASW
jgi:hypothetical protein